MNNEFEESSTGFKSACEFEVNLEDMPVSVKRHGVTWNLMESAPMDGTTVQLLVQAIEGDTRPESEFIVSYTHGSFRGGKWYFMTREKYGNTTLINEDYAKVVGWHPAPKFGIRFGDEFYPYRYENSGTFEAYGWTYYKTNFGNAARYKIVDSRIICESVDGVSGPVGGNWSGMESAPKDGRMLRLLVDPSSRKPSDGSYSIINDTEGWLEDGVWWFAAKNREGELTRLNDAYAEPIGWKPYHLVGNARLVAVSRETLTRLVEHAEEEAPYNGTDLIEVTRRARAAL